MYTGSSERNRILARRGQLYSRTTCFYSKSWKCDIHCHCWPC